MNTDDYKYILTIAEEGSITRAAEKLFITQPALSQRIKHVRKELGIDLFITDKTGIHLTNDGHCFARYAQKILMEEENMKRELQEMHNMEGGSMTIGVSQMSGSKYFQNLIIKFHDLHPNVNINICEYPSSELKRLLQNGKIDLGILHMPHRNSLSGDFRYEVIFYDRMVFLASADSNLKKYFYYKDRCPIPYIQPQLLANEPLALPESGTLVFSLFYDILKSAGVTPKINHLSRSYSMLSSFVEMGLSNAVLLQSYLKKDVKDGDYSLIDTDLRDNVPTVISWISDRYLSKTMEQFIAIARQLWTSIYPYQS